MSELIKSPKTASKIVSTTHVERNWSVVLKGYDDHENVCAHRLKVNPFGTVVFQWIEPDGEAITVRVLAPGSFDHIKLI